MKSTTVTIFLFLGLFFALTPQAQAYSLPDSGVYFGCLWRDASCTTNSVREDVPTPTEMPKFYLDVIESCTAAGYNGGVCALQASKAVVAAETYTTCMVESGGDATGCKTATDFRVNQVTVAQPAPVDQNAPPPVPMQTLQPQPATPTQNQTQTQGTSPVNTSYTGNGNLGYTPLEPLPGLAEVQGGNTNFARLLQSGFSVLISIGALSAVVMLIFGGITYMVSDVVHKKTGALHRIQAALWGLLLLVASWLILNTINPSLTNFALILNPTPPPSVSGLNTVTSGTVGNFTVADNDPNLDSKLNNWCPGGLTDQVSSQSDEFGTQFSTYVCSPPDSR